MKHLIVLAIYLFGSVSASYLHAAPAHHIEPAIVAPVAAVNTGSSTQYRSQDNIGNYAFGYNEQHSQGGTYRRETGDAYGNKVGSYGLRDIDGRVRVVNYVADGLGFRASIATNEPGTAAQAPAATSISSPHVLAPHASHLIPVHADPHAHAHLSPIAHSIAGPAAILPSHLHGHGHPGLLAAPTAHYGLAHDLGHAYPIRR